MLSKLDWILQWEKNGEGRYMAFILKNSFLNCCKLTLTKHCNNARKDTVAGHGPIWLVCLNVRDWRLVPSALKRCLLFLNAFCVIFAKWMRLHTKVRSALSTKWNMKRSRSVARRPACIFQAKHLLVLYWWVIIYSIAIWTSLQSFNTTGVRKIDMCRLARQNQEYLLVMVDIFLPR